ncbi:hypothetical protein BG015_009829 [Linnemannia schmuckeri]|uniref:Uncharacterized protein n=1 Tax=Linnemannia schmuckeri TaxID=64567 RepID=A0A9P5S8U4_9FUNG|nr:hypothetical protein BG015_009829 [Linnemannia schmuckeri]
MLQLATISTPSPAPAVVSSPATPKTPRQQNRKSAITVGLQNQNQNQNTSTQQSSGRSNNRQPRNAAQTHARHQSMPAQQRSSSGTPPASSIPNTNNSKGNNNSSTNNVTILKRSSATVAAPVPTPIVSGIQILQSQPSPKQQQRNQKPRSQGQGHSQQQSNNNNGSAAKQRSRKGRRDIDTSGSESMAKADAADAGLNESSPTLNPSSPPSSTDSDDSESATSHPSHRTHKDSQRRQNGQFPKGYGGPLSVSPPQRPSSAPVVPQLRKGYVVDDGLRLTDMSVGSTRRSDGMFVINSNLILFQNDVFSMATLQKQHNGQQQYGNRKPSFGSASVYPTDMGDGVLRPNVTKATSADKIMLADRVTAEKKSTLYAGPTFHNSPAPTSLPIPAFARSWGNSPVEPAVEKLPASPFFAEAASPHLNSLRPQRTQSETSGWTAHHSMPAHSFNMGYNYQTSGYSIDGPTMHGTDQLMEISQNIRNLLKIPSQ